MQFLTLTLRDGLLICIPFTGFVLVSFWFKPRLWLHSLPLDIQKLAPPKTNSEKKQTSILLIVYLFILPGSSLLSTFSLLKVYDLSIFQTIAHLYGLWLIVHFWDLILDGVHIVIFHKLKPPIAGTEQAVGWYKLDFHIRSFLKASLNSVMFVIPVSLLMWVLLEQ